MKEKTESKTKINPMIVTIVVVVLVAVAAFFGGMKYQQSKVMAFGGRGNAQFARGGGQGAGAPGNRGNGAPVIGEISSADDKSVTVKMMDGSSKIVLLSESTTYSKSETGSKADLTVGTQVGIFGTANSDGSVTAQNVQLNPQFGRRMNVGASPVPSAGN